jgi:hypothetical protein
MPGLQPWHADLRLPFLGSELWRLRSLCEWCDMPPHPFP